MCGIVGLWKTSVDRPLATVERMLDAMAHRGPDGRGCLEFAGGAAGMVRLALVDLTARGQQPLWSLDRKVAILFNGEIYNFREERARLESRGFRFRTATDTEVILNLYLECGLTFVDRLRGMYAIAIFDWRESAPGGMPTLVLARDPLGIKPLYIAHPDGDPEQVAFSSEVRALLRSGLVPAEVDREGLADYMSLGFVAQPRTILRGVRMLEPGHLECYAPEGSVRRIQFWKMPPAEARNETLDEAAERLRYTLDESVALHSLADAPVGAFLSGGIDSTGVVGLMLEHMSNLRTYTLRFPDLPGQDEAKEAANAARAFGCRHTVVDITSEEIPRVIGDFARDLDQPSTDGLNTWLVSRAAAGGVKAVLSGLGGDEWFAGYPVTRRMARYSSTSLGRLQAISGRLATHLCEFVPAGKLRRRIDSLATRKSSVATWLQAHAVFADPLARRLAGVGMAAESQEQRYVELLDKLQTPAGERTAVGISCLLDTRVYMLNQLLRDADATSMSHSLELRVPLADIRVAGFAWTCADDYKLYPDGGKNSQYERSGAKRVLIRAMGNMLPPSIVNRPKRGFTLPTVHWMQTTLRPLIEDACSPAAIARRGLVDPGLCQQLWSDWRAGRADVLYPRLWSLLILELWARAVLDPSSSVNPEQHGLTIQDSAEQPF